MSQPEIVQTDLGGEEIVARVDLGGEDELYVTPTRTLVYRAEGLLADESVEEFSHEAERITVSKGRRKSKVTLDYGLDGEKTIALPTKRLERALQPIVEGVLRNNGVLAEDETVAQLFRFSELTIVIASERIVRHIGAGLWDDEFESYHYDDVTDLEFEGGSVNTSVVLTVDGQRERFKTPNEDARAVRSALETTLLSYWGVDSIEELRAAAQPDEESEEPEEREDVSFGDGPDPLFADPAEPEDLPENATRSADDRRSDADTTPPSSEPTEPSASEGQTPDPESDTSRETDVGTEQAETTTAESHRASASDTEPDTGSAPVERNDPSSNASREAADGRTEPNRSPASETDSETPERGPDESATRSEQSNSDASDSGFEGSGFQAAAPATDEEVREELVALRETVDQQTEELRAQRELIEQLIEELRRGR